MAAAATSILSLHNMPAFADSLAGGATSDSPGVLSGNTVEVPVHVPVNACGNSVDVVGLLNPAFGNSCGNQGNSGGQVTPVVPRQPGSSDTGTGTPQTPLPAAPPVARTPAPRLPSPAEQPQRGTASQERQDDSSTYRARQLDATPMGGASRAALAETGSGTMLATSGLSAALMVGGLILYRRGRAAYRR
ncbi:chaplin [Streptomyces brasiliensis]|uniref:chaplin n=1 Tax=Streptomyces brasiliensis TaxID=1954 RepID=UPI001E535CDD|nr:chaplin [Streptomyces brasiliensis]